MQEGGSKKIFKGFIILISIIFIVQLFNLQILQNQYKNLARTNYVKVIVDRPLRGVILDRDGRTLVSNKENIKLYTDPEEKNFLLQKLENPKFHDNQEKETSFIFSKIEKKNKRKAKEKKTYICQQFTQEEWIGIQESLYEKKNYFIEKTFERSYSRPILAQVLGYTGEIDARELSQDVQGSKYVQGDCLGKSGLEKYYEKYLRGEKGVKYVKVNVAGVFQGEYADGSQNVPPVSGKNIVTTIDSELQEYGEALMRNKVGSIVAIEPASGEILCIVSAPFYDPNSLVRVGLKKNYSKLLLHPKKPLFNRAVSATYAPGSIFKTAQAIVGLEMRVIDKKTRFPCDKSYIGCHPHADNLDLRGAIANSCNPYFGFLFRKIINRGRSMNKFIDSSLGLEDWSEMMKKFGFGARLGIDLTEEVKGVLPNSQYYDKIYGKLAWKQSTIRSLDIGQGEMLITPLQMCNMAVIIANRGFYIKPHLVKRIEDIEESEQPKFNKEFLGFSNVDYEFFVESMYDTVEYGTAKRAKIPGIEVCAKTGTSQNNLGSKEDHSVCIAFAPKDNPKIVVAVYVENAGWGSRAATAIAGLIIEKYLLREVQRKSIEEYAMRESFKDEC